MFKINVNFFTVIASFNAVILGFLVPFSNNSILKVKKLLPQQLLEDFNKRTNTKDIVFHSSTSLFIVVLLILFFDYKTSIFFLSLLSFIYFIYILKRIHIFYLALVSYEDSIDVYIELKEKVNISFVDNISDYFESVNKIGIQIIKEKNFNRISDILKDINEFIEKLFLLNQNDFESIMIEKDSKSRYEDSKSKKFSQIMFFYLNIYKCMIDNEKEYISWQMIYNFDDLTKYLTSNKKEYIDYKAFFTIFFESQDKIVDYALEKNSIYLSELTYRWYTSDIFNCYDKENNFNLEFLELYDKQLFKYMKKIINLDKFEVYTDMLDWFQKGIGFHSKDYLGFYEITGFEDNELYEKGQVLENSYNEINSINKLKDWIIRFDKLKFELSEKQDVIEKLIEIKKDAYQSFYFSNLKKRIRELGTYLLYKKKYEWIEYLWEFQQPKESKSININTSILMTENELINLFKREQPFTYFGFIHDGNKDFSYFVEHYDFIYLCHLLSINDSTQVSLGSDKSDTELESIKYYLKNLIEIKENYNDFFNFKIKRKNVKKFLKNLVTQCDNTITEKVKNTDIRVDKKEEFQREFLSRYKQVYGMLEVYTKYLKKNNFINKEENALFGINTLVPKDMFVKENVDGSIVASSLARDVLHGVNNNILKLILLKCQKSEELVFSNILKNVDIDNNTIILAVNAWTEMRSESYFEDKYINNENELDINSFFGWYVIKELRIPVFNINDNSFEKQYVILNNATIPKLNRYEMKDTDIEIELISEKIELEIIKKLSDEEKEIKKEELKTQVHIKAYESFNLEEIDDNQIGYIFKL